MGCALHTQGTLIDLYNDTFYNFAVALVKPKFREL